jgi:excisionase family DNA binding protein
LAESQHHPFDDRSEWLSLGDASKTLGVNSSSLRRWADAGLVRTFRTPGGHRRFSASDLDRLMGAGVDPAQELDDDAVARIRERLNSDEGLTHSWLDRLAPNTRHDLAELGRRMVHLVEAYVAENSNEPSLEAEAAEIGTGYAEVLHLAQVGLTEAVTAFVYFRRGMDQALRTHAGNLGLSGEAAEQLWEKAATLEDRVLVALTAAYEQHPQWQNDDGADSVQNPANGGR